ncbi:MAG TPA: glycosyltransferase [Burkholderiaceae bacterium]|jgi:glycosyltransferase involved in cell wall biosynthesis
MRVTHVNFARGFRGGERQTFNLIEGLAKLGVGQLLVCRNESELGRRVRALGVDTIEAHHPLLGHVRSPSVDLIHVHEARGAYWAAIENRLRNIPYVITRRIPNPLSRSRITACVYAHAEKLFGVSQDVSVRLARQTGLQVETVLSSAAGFVAHGDVVRKTRESIGGGPVIGHVGALHDHHKGQSVLIRAFQVLSRDYPDARLIFVGDGADRAMLQELAQGDKRIHFAGFQEDVGSWIALMDVFCFPSREEGLGSSVLDAMSLGVPVVAAAVGGLPELIGRNERGLLVPDHDPHRWDAAIRRVLTEKESARAWIDAGLDFAGSNGVAAMSKAYLCEYQHILSQRRSRAKQSAVDSQYS